MSDTHTIGIAAVKVVRKPDLLRTVLGSCVGVALCDSDAGIGGLAHVILPSSEHGSGDPGKFADTAVDMLLDEMLSAGARRSRIRAKIAGGAYMFGSAASTGIGERNVIAVKKRLSGHELALLAEEVGGDKGRKITLDPESGVVQVQIIGQEPTAI